MRFGWLTAVVLVSACVANQATADLVVNYDFSGLSGTPAAVSAAAEHSNVTASTLTRGSGITAVSANNAFESSGWTTATSVDLNDYYGFTLMPDAGFMMTLTDISFGEKRDNDGILKFEIRSSLDSFAAAIAGTVTTIGPGSGANTWTFGLGSAFQDLTTAVGLRIYGYDADNAGGTWRLQNFGTNDGLVVNGSVAAVPEPAAFLFGGMVCSVIGVAAGFRWLKCKKSS